MFLFGLETIQKPYKSTADVCPIDPYLYFPSSGQISPAFYPGTWEWRSTALHSVFSSTPKGN